MPIQNPSATGGGKAKYKQKLTKLEQAMRRVEKLGNNIPGPVGRDPFSPDPTQTQKDTKRLYPVSSIPVSGDDFRTKGVDRNRGTRLVEDLQKRAVKATKKSSLKDKLREGLPPKGNGVAPGVISPGTGLGGAAAIAKILRNTGAGHKVNAGGNIAAETGVRAGVNVRPGINVKAGGNIDEEINVSAGGRIPSVDTSLDVNNKGSARRAYNAAAVEYNPQLDAIRTLVAQTQNQGQRGIQQTDDAYDSLQAGLQRDVPRINNNFDASQAKTSAIYDALNTQIQDQYGGTAARDTAEFERLGISQANPVLQGQTADRDFLSKIAALQGQSANDSSELLQSGAAGLARNNAAMAGFAGANAQTDQRNNLADELLKLRSQKTSVEEAKGKSIRELTDQYKDEETAQAERTRAFELDAEQFRESVRTDRRDFKYGRETNERDFAANQETDQRNFRYGKQTDQRDFRYGKQTDERDFRYGKQTDERNFAANQETDRRNFISNQRTDRRDFRYGRKMDEVKVAMDSAALQAAGSEVPETDWDSLDPAETAAAKADQLVPGSGDRMFAYLQNLIRSNKDIQRGFYLKDDGTGKKIQVKMTAEKFGTLAANNAKIAGLPKGSVQKIASTYWSEK